MKDLKNNSADKVFQSRLSQAFHNLKILASETDITIERMRDFLGQQSHALLIMILSLPFLTPVPIPGLSTILGLIICFVSISWLLRKNPWIPKKWLAYKIAPETLVSITSYGEKISKKLEVLVKPRFVQFFEHTVFRFLLTVTLVLCAVFLALPLPPGTNFPPALTLFILSLSILEEDFILAVLGLLVFIGNIYLLNQAVSFLKDYIVTFF